VGNYYVNEEVRKMYGIPLSQLTPEQRKILKADGERRKKLIEERQKDFMKNNRRAFDDADKMNSVLSQIYSKCQKEILADVSETIAKVKKAGGEWSYANQSALTRSRGLFEQINKELVKLGKTEETYFRTHLTNIYTDQFLRSVYTLGQTQPLKGTGSFNMLNTRLVNAALDYPWSGAMFSDRLWTDKDRLGRNLRIGLTQSMILGEDMDQIADRIGANINTSRYNAMRIARTETKRVTYASQVAAWEEQGITEVKYMAANGGDSRSCDLCRADNGKKFKLGEEPTLPRHPNCRCWYAPVTPDTFGDNELNDLTGSVRGAENYDKWKQEYEVALNSDGSYKKGWARESWENGGKVMYTAQDGKKYSIQEYKQALANGTFGDDSKPTAESLIRERIEAERKEGEEYRQGLQMQISAKEELYKNVPGQYSTQISEIESKKALQSGIMDSRSASMDELNASLSGITKKRADAMELYDAGKITEDEYDELSKAIRAERRSIRDQVTKLEDEYYSAYSEKSRLEDELQRIQKEIKAKQDQILTEISGLNKDIQKSLAKELDLSLDIDYVGDSMERLKTVDSFRTIREALRANDSFDFDKYKDELVKMAQRMDEEALTVQTKIAPYVAKNAYNLKDTGWYNWSRVEMDMSSNTHERALGNGLIGSWQTKFHEEGHQIDHILGSVDEFCDNKSRGLYSCITNMECSVGKAMEEALSDDILSFVNEAIEDCNKRGSSYKALSSLDRISADAKSATIKYLGELTSNCADRATKCQLGILTDAIGCFTSGRIHPYTYGYWGHKMSYCTSVGKNGGISETWATFCALRVCGSPEDVATVKKLMPKTWNTMSKTYSKIAKYLQTHDL
jgi:SPP1 gp7 family putative phage head morphogenesis protein